MIEENKIYAHHIQPYIDKSCRPKHSRFFHNGKVDTDYLSKPVLVILYLNFSEL